MGRGEQHSHPPAVLILAPVTGQKYRAEVPDSNPGQ